MDNGMIQSKRTPVDKRIVSHHKTSKIQSKSSLLSEAIDQQSIVKFEGPGPILQIIFQLSIDYKRLHINYHLVR